MDDYAAYQAFSPQAYLKSYYDPLGSEADGLLRFLTEAFATLPPEHTLLEFGAGPTIISLICAADKAAHIDTCDYVAENRAVVERWLAGDESDFDWTPYFVRALQLEGVAEPTPEQIAARAARIRAVTGPVVACDITQEPPVATGRHYDVIISNYCLDAVTGDKAEWQAHIRKLKWLLKPGGTLLLSSLRQATYSDFGETRYPNVYLLEADLPDALTKAGFDPLTIRVTTAEADHPQREYSGVIFASAVEF